MLIFLLILGAAVFALAQYLRRTGMFFPDRYPNGRWDIGQWQIVPTEHWLTTRDGVRLHAWLFRATDADAPVMLWFHGNAGNLTDRAEMAAEHARRGVSVFLFDYRGFGRSGGKTSESQLFLDGEAAFAFVRTLGAKRIVLYGESVGGPYAARIARDHKGEVAAVIIENSFPSLKDIGNTLYAPLPLGWMAPFALRTTHWLNEAGVPVLVMHGKRDAVIPYALGSKLYEELRVPKEMLTSPNAGHCEIPLFDAPRYYETVIRFAKTAK
ncbi:MAG TPA: alpha/beta hydrolase [Thermoanaerobaculia bacterium]